VNAKLTEWKQQELPRRAGVSAFGVGGTNAHVILEEPPTQPSIDSARPAQLLLLSARSEQALEKATDNLAEHLKAQQDLPLADVAWTLQVGRRRFPYRRTAVVHDIPDAIQALSQRARTQVQTRSSSNDSTAVYFLFPGQGSQHPNMGRQAYESEPVFRQWVDRCCEILLPHLGEDLLPLLYPSHEASESEKRRLTDTALAQPAIFTVEYALAQLWISWGIQPHGMLGHSVGEFVAACLAGVFSLEDALALIASRSRLMQTIAPGGMLSVRLPESEIRARLNGNGHLAIAAVNAPSLCAVAGPLEALDDLESQLNNEGVATRRLVTSHAFHSSMMDPILDQFSARVAQTHLRPPQIPFVSCVSGTWINESEATDPSYWARHLRAPVQFSAGVQELLKRSGAVLLEVGPGNVLSTLARQHVPRQNGNTGDSTQNAVTIVSSFGDATSGGSSSLHLLNAVGSLWAAGLQPEWEALHAGERRRRVSLPTYPFERKKFWLKAPASQTQAPSEMNPIPATEATGSDMSFEETQSVTHNSHGPTLDQPAAADRAAVISTIVSEIFTDLSGVQLQSSDASSTFLEMGFDSLFLTQVTQAIQYKFALKVTFRQLLGDQSSLRSLTEFIDSHLPADAFAPKEVPARREVGPESAATSATPQTQLRTQPPAPANSTSSTSGTAVEHLMREQMQAMNQLFAKQLEALRGISPESPPKPQNELLQAAPTSIAKVAPSSTPSAAAPQETREFKPFGPYKPPQKGNSAQLTERHQKHIRELIERCTKRTAKSKSMTQQYRARLADPRVVSGFRAPWKEMVYPILTVRSKGSRLWDVDGNEYIDILNGFGPIMLGHRPDFVERAIEQQLREGFEIGPQTPLAGQIAEMFCGMTGNERMTFCNTGSEAVIAALRVARTVTGRSKVVLFAGSYHGMFDEVLVKGVKGSDTPRSLPIAPGIPRESVGNVVVLDYGTSESLEWIRTRARELAAVLVEPVQSRHPNLQPREFLREIRQITQDSGAALIFDEVVTGFRVHPGGCQALFDTRADLATYGKVLAGGLPIGVLAGKSQFMDALDGGTWQFGDDSYPSVGVTFFAGTFHRHPLTLAAVKAVLEHFHQQGPQLQQELTAKTSSLVGALNALFEKASVPARIETFGSIFYFSFPTDFPLGGLLYYHLREKGIYILEGFPCFLTTAHSDADIAKIVRAFDESIAEMQAAGILPERSSLTTAENEELSSIRPAEAPAVQDPAPSIEVPLTEAQMEIWLSAQLGEDASCAFNESFTLLMRGQLDTRALRDSLQDLVNRHQALHATIIPERNSLRFSGPSKISVAFEDLSSASESHRATALQNAKQEEASTPFDLINGPVIRLRLFRLEPQLHALIVTSHHIVCDGWSTNVLLNDLSALYTARRAATSPALPSALQFSEYARQQAQKDDEEVAAYWLKRFEQTPPVLELPTDRTRPAVKSFKGATYRTRIDASICKQIRQAGAKQGCTLFATLLTGFASLLRRLTAQTDIVIGIPTAGQSLLDNGNLVGHCVNFLPIRVHLIEGQSAAELLHQVKRTLLDAQDHQSYTYGTLVRNLKLRRDPSRLPLVEVQFNLEKVGANLNFPGLQVEVDPNPKAAVNFDLFVNIVESDHGLVIDCDYNSDLFDRETIARWLTHFETLLKGLAANVHQEVDRLPLLGDAELRQILHDWNAPHSDYPRDKCVHDLIEDQTARNPGAVAVSFEGSSLTYAQLDKRANQLARHLIKIGVEPGSLVGIALDRSLDLLVGLLAIWKAGAAYLPLDAAYPRDRIAVVIEETSLATLLTHSKLLPNLPIFDTRPICLDRDWVLIERERETCPAINLEPSSIAYTIYTSGSTGKPKGVEVTHRNVVNLLWSMRQTPGLHDRDRLLAVTTLSFDIAALELFLPLIAGAQVILASRDTAQDPRLLIDLLNESKPTVMQATPATWRLLLEAGWPGFPGLRMLCGGEALPRKLADQLLERGELWNMYGPTETTIWSATSRVEAGEGPVTIGPPIHNTRFYVLDDKQQPAPIGVPGELHIGGDGVAKGYFRNAQLTAERFIPDPFSQLPTDRLYKTGDLVRYSSDGKLEFLGRLDNQVKVRGFRIELGEIESVLARNPDIRECVIAAQEDEPGSNRLVAYCVPHESRKCSSEDLRNWVAASLPEYMIPSVFVIMPALPHTPNGKVDRKALVRLDALSLPEQNLFVAPRNAAEAKLAAVCAEVLHLDRVSVHDSLFDLGADSIHLFLIIARAAQVGIALAPQQILRLRTIAALAADASENGVTQRKLEKIARVPREQYQLDAAPQAT
jgi:amino acid adenylation domain-containing protein